MRLKVKFTVDKDQLISRPSIKELLEQQMAAEIAAEIDKQILDELDKYRPTPAEIIRERLRKMSMEQDNI